jgi:hypothetical protein
VSALRRNLTFLKENLQAEEVLDRLYEKGIFSSYEKEECQVIPTRTGKSKLLVEKLILKSPDAYKSFCIILEETGQNFIKEKLDTTASNEGTCVCVRY